MIRVEFLWWLFRVYYVSVMWPYRYREQQQHGVSVNSTAYKIFAVERSQRNVFPFLDIPGTPVVEQDEAENVLRCSGNRHRRAQLITHPDHCSLVASWVQEYSTSFIRPVSYENLMKHGFLVDA